MSNPFENNEAAFNVVVNAEGQHSLWPAFAEIPAGWEKVAGPDEREVCLRYVEENWTDIRPRSLVNATGN